MSLRPARSTALLIAALAAAASSHGQQSRDPHSGYVYPAGGQTGTTLEATVGGQYLAGAKEAVFSRPGIKATVTGYRKPLPAGRVNELQDYLREQLKIRHEKAKAMESPEMVAEILKEAGATEEEVANFLLTRAERRNSKRQKNAQLEETVTLRVEIDPNAPCGPGSLRLVTATGTTNPVTFCIGRLPEVSHVEGEKAPQTVQLPAVLNGRILPGESHGYSFNLQRGETIAIVTQAHDLIPYLADAVPGWFAAVATIYDPAGRPMPTASFYRQGPDPVYSFTAPEAGSYRLEIRDALRRGREDFVYRIPAGRVPFVGGIFPLGGREEQPLAVNVRGLNLPIKQTFPIPATDAGVHALAGLSNGFATGDVAAIFDDLPEVVLQPSEATPRRVTPPIAINGKINRPGSVGAVTLRCEKGERLVAEVFARRLNSPLDSWLRVLGPNGRQVAFNDDAEDREAALITDQADSRVEFTAEESGPYRVEIGDTRHSGGDEYAYRLRISPPTPDFAVRITPSAINGRTGGQALVTLHIARKDGFRGAVDVRLKNPPPGFALHGARIPEGADRVQATVALPAIPTEWPVPLEFKGIAQIDGKEVVRAVVPADEMLQAFFYHHLVPAEECLVMSIGNKPGNMPMSVSERLKIPAGGSGSVVVSRNGKLPFSITDTTLELREAPAGISIESITPVKDGAAISFRCNSEAKAGTCGNLLVEAFGEKRQVKPGEKSGAARWSMGLLPAISFEITNAEALPPKTAYSPAL